MHISAWNDRFSLGVPVIDDQHRQLFFFIESLEQDVLRHKSVDDCGLSCALLLSELRKWAEIHFAVEEAVMALSGYPGAAAHAKQHYGFMKQIEDLHRLANHGPQADAHGATLRFLREWLTSHIATQDWGWIEHARSILEPRQAETLAPRHPTPLRSETGADGKPADS